MLRKGDEPVSRAGVMRLRTVEGIDVLIGRLRAMHAELVACPDEADEVRALVHACATMAGIWLDDLACRFADTGYSADDLFTAAWELLESLSLAPSGFESTADPGFFAVLRDAVAGMLARLWITGYLLGPVPTDAWPNGDMARQGRTPTATRRRGEPGWCASDGTGRQRAVGWLRRMAVCPGMCSWLVGGLLLGGGGPGPSRRRFVCCRRA